MRNKRIVLIGLAGALVLSLVWFIQSDQSARANTRNDAPGQRAPSFADGTYQVFLPLVMKSYITPSPLWRFGVAQIRRSLSAYDSNGVASMRFGWHVDFTATLNAPLSYGMEYVPTLRVKQWKFDTDGTTWTQCRVAVVTDGYDPHYVTPYTYTVSLSTSNIQARATSRPGMTWLIGNEIERVDWGSGSCARQDEILPELYAQAYHDLYNTIKTADPTAQVAFGGMVEFTDLRRQYLDRVWAEYTRLYSETMPVDVWNIHLYVLQEVRDSWGASIPAGFTQATGTIYTVQDNKDFTKAWQMILNMRAWMDEKGEQNKPLIVTEYGVNFPPDYEGFSAAQVRDSYLYPAFNYFLNQTDASTGYLADGNRLVQRWNWWSLDYDDGSCDGSNYLLNFGGALFDSGLGPSGGGSCTFPPQGIAELGTYWRSYVAALPSGSVKPYASSALTGLTRKQTTAPIVPSIGRAATTDCPENRRVRVRLYEPAGTGFSMNGLAGRSLTRRAAVSKLSGESTLCLPAGSK